MKSSSLSVIFARTYEVYERLLFPRCGRVQWQSFTEIEQYVDCYTSAYFRTFEGEVVEGE